MVPIRLLVVVLMVLMVIAVSVSCVLFFIVIDPLVWLLTGNHTSTDERGEQIMDVANSILNHIQDKIEKIGKI